jgi:molybdopterin converting factor small subunit
MVSHGVKIVIPSALRKYCDDQCGCTLEAESLTDAVMRLVERFPNLKPHLIDEQGKIQQFVNIFLNGELVFELDDQENSLRGKDEVLIVPALAGG